MIMENLEILFLMKMLNVKMVVHVKAKDLLSDKEDSKKEKKSFKR